MFSEIRKDIKILSNMIQDEEICFDFIARDKDIPGFVVGYIDQKRDIRINVELDIESFEKGKAKSEIFFKNINKRLNLSGDFYDLYLSKKLPYDVYREFQEWKRLKLIVRENNYHNNNYYTRHSAKMGTCIYCNGTIMSGQTCCYSCRQKYEKHRNIGGGYPSYDPNTKGSNSNW